MTEFRLFCEHRDSAGQVVPQPVRSRSLPFFEEIHSESDSDNKSEIKSESEDRQRQRDTTETERGETENLTPHPFMRACHAPRPQQSAPECIALRRGENVCIAALGSRMPRQRDDG